MKKIILLVIFTTIFTACTNKNEIPKPSKPIDKETMENILYDLALLQALRNYNPEKLTENGINAKTYIFKKYKIDSLQLHENNKYFAADVEEYKLMFENVSNRLLAEKKVADATIKKQDAAKSKKIRDSMIRNSKKPKKPIKTKVLAKG
jgi:Domain of unknown function (DUF4296)